MRPRGWLVAGAVLAACSAARVPPPAAPRPVARSAPPPAAPRPVPRACPMPEARAVRLGARAHEDALGRHPQPRNLHLTYADEPASTLVVQWVTDDDTLASEVRFGLADGPLDLTARGVSFFVLGARKRRYHEVRLCGLEPGRRYLYQAGGAGLWSARAGFVTAPADARDVRALVLGDSRSSSARRWRQVAARAISAGVDVVFFTGDAVSNGASQARWDAFFEAAPELFANTPLVWADGNHEGRSPLYSAQFALPEAPGAGPDGHWYALDYGPLRLVVLNDVTVPVEVIQGAETDFLQRTLAAVNRRRTPFVLTMHHRPLYTTSDEHQPYAPTRQAWLPHFDAHHVDLDLAGHVHSYESSHPLREEQVTDPSRGTVYFNYGGAGATLYGFRRRAAWLLNRESVHGYAVLAADARRVVWDAFRADGSRIERVELQRPP